MPQERAIAAVGQRHRELVVDVRGLDAVHGLVQHGDEHGAQVWVRQQVAEGALGERADGIGEIDQQLAPAGLLAFGPAHRQARARQQRVQRRVAVGDDHRRARGELGVQRSQVLGVEHDAHRQRALAGAALVQARQGAHAVEGRDQAELRRGRAQLVQHRIQRAELGAEQQIAGVGVEEPVRQGR